MGHVSHVFTNDRNVLPVNTGHVHGWLKDALNTCEHGPCSRAVLTGAWYTLPVFTARELHCVGVNRQFQAKLADCTVRVAVLGWVHTTRDHGL